MFRISCTRSEELTKSRSRKTNARVLRSTIHPNLSVSIVAWFYCSWISVFLYSVEMDVGWKCAWICVYSVQCNVYYLSIENNKSTINTYNFLVFFVPRFFFFYSYLSTGISQHFCILFGILYFDVWLAVSSITSILDSYTVFIWN